MGALSTSFFGSVEESMLQRNQYRTAQITSPLATLWPVELDELGRPQLQFYVRIPLCLHLTSSCISTLSSN